MREALLVLASTVTDTRLAFGTKEQVDPIQHLIGAASAWGANSPADAIYLNVTPQKNDGTTVYQLTVKDVPVDGFRSVIVYNAQGFIPQNDRKVYSFNNVTAKKERGRIRHDPVRWVHRPDRQLHSDRSRLDLHGAVVSPAARDRERRMDVPGRAGGGAGHSRPLIQ